MNPGARLGAAATPLRERWQALSARERQGVGFGAAALGLFLLWAVALQPAWRTLSTAPARIATLQSQAAQMRLLADEVRELRAAPALTPEQSAAALQAATARLGEQGRLMLQGDRAVLTLNNVSTSQLRDWLAEARSGARARPVEASLQRGPEGISGTLVVALGGAS